MIQLHLGCGNIYLENWTNCDINGILADNNPDLVAQNKTTITGYYKYPYGKPYKDIGKRPGNNMPVVDMLLNLTEIPYPFEDNSVDRILAVSVLEHFTETEAQKILKEWHRILKPKGYTWIDVPDLTKTAKLLKSDNMDMVKWAVSLIYGSHKNEFSFHKWGYTPQYLLLTCLDIGFASARVARNLIRHEYPMFMVEATK